MLITCYHCNKEFSRSTGHVNENKKLGHKYYCSIQCIGLSRNHQTQLICENPRCNKIFARRKSAISLHNYCSRSCSATINNVKFPKNPGFKKKCAVCLKQFTGRKKYCSVFCKLQDKRIPKKEILQQLQYFYKHNGRIPLKREFNHVNSARKSFGSWNKAIIAAGFDPNPVMFSKKHIAKDGHTCDSLSEKIIDDWLFRKKIIHQRSVPYGLQQMTADFVVDDTFIEFLGLQGQLKRYDLSLARKESLWKERGLKIIKIYPKDLFPNNKLNEILGILSQ